MENTDCIKKIYLVGGAVRDSLLKAPIKDKDYVAVGYVESDFATLKKVGKSFPVFLQNDGTQIALARKETKISQGYNGFSVCVKNVSLQDDLKRRDLTINAIAFDEEEGVYIDPFNGRADLKNKILRHVSSAFCEDPLRVLRIARFRARFGLEWKIHSTTKLLIFSMKDELKHLEPNRVFKEVESAMLGGDSYLFFNTLFELGVLDVLFPNLYELTCLKEGNLHHLEPSVFAHTMEVLKYANEFFLGIPQDMQNAKNSLILQFSALFHDIAKPHCYRHFGNSSGHDGVKLVECFLDITLPNAIKKAVLLLISNHINIALLGEMRHIRVVYFLESFKGNLELFYLQIALFLADMKGRDSKVAHKMQSFSDFAPYINAFKELNEFSLKQWCKENNPTIAQIKAYSQKKKIEIIKKSLSL